MAGSSVTTTDPSGNPCDEMAAMPGMNVMGESMAAMANHMCVTAMRPRQPGDGLECLRHLEPREPCRAVATRCS